MEINGQRLLDSLRDLARIGADPNGGISRLAFSAEDRAGRDFVADRLRSIGLEPHVDPIGNLWCLRAGTVPDSAPVLLGSHTDTVARGGAFDGALGVLSAVEVLARLQESRTETRHAVGLVSFVNEEGVRFMPDMMGSLYYRGDLDEAAVRKIVGTDGTTIGENLDLHGLAGTDPLPAVRPHAFLELHIEQGPVLESMGQSVGAVYGVQGLRWLELTIRGSANHAGTTPMEGRRDPSVMAAGVIQAARQLTLRIPGLRATVGRLLFRPNLINVIPAEATLTVDLRHPEQPVLDAATDRLLQEAASLAAQSGLALHHHETASAPAVAFSPNVVEAVAEAASDLGVQAPRIISGAGHDAQIMAGWCDSGMIFIRSRGGISHSPEEHSSDGDVVTGANVLLGAALRLAAGPGETAS